MKKTIYPLVLAIAVVGISCQDEFLEKPLGSDTTVDSIFSTSQKVQAAIAQAYSWSLLSGLPGEGTWDGDFQTFRESTIGMISGEVNATYQSWQDAYKIERGGMTADDGSGRTLSEDGFDYNYVAIRHDHLVIENIDKVKDMADAEKEQVKAEMKTLIAYRYEEMFKRYGGVPLVTKSLSVQDSIKIPRASVQQTLGFIVKLCDEAAAALPDSYPPQWKGRVTKGVALAVKAEALMYAARPLFNSAEPYLDLSGTSESGSNNDLICFGNVDPTRWQAAADASQAVLDWSLANGYFVIDTDSPLDDYGTATSTPSNPEVLLAYKHQYENDNFYDLFNIHSGYMAQHNGMSYMQLTQYQKEDGTELTWAGTTALPYSQYFDNMQVIEARYKASAIAAGMDAWNNPNSEYWSSTGVAGSAGREACGKRSKFWYHADTRSWFEYPLYRVAEFYLDLAEAYNELDQPGKALPYLNVIRNRAGLPDVTETDKTLLRQIIQREWAVEFYEEGHRLFDVKHWKLPDIANGILGGAKKAFAFQYTNGRTSGSIAAHYAAYSTKVVYTAFWGDKEYLHPFPSREANKGYLVQNPGY
jgi:hypothetical protein